MEQNDVGYVKIFRKLRHNKILKLNDSYLRLFMLMIFDAEFQDNNDGLEVGQLVISWKKYKHELPNMNKDKYNNALKLFAKHNMIKKCANTDVTRSSHASILVTICNYEQFCCGNNIRNTDVTRPSQEHRDISIIEEERRKNYIYPSKSGNFERDSDSNIMGACGKLKSKLKKEKFKSYKKEIETLYNEIYPRKLGKSGGIKKLSKVIKTDQDLENLEKAILNYVKEVEDKNTDTKYIKYFSTFANCWEDFIHLEEYNKPILLWGEYA
jgi:hypothetical protein